MGDIKKMIRRVSIKRVKTHVRGLAIVIYIATPIPLLALGDEISHNPTRVNTVTTAPKPLDKSGYWAPSSHASYIWKEAGTDETVPLIEYSERPFAAGILLDSIEKAHRISSYSKVIELNNLSEEKVLMVIIDKEKGEYELYLVISTGGHKSSLIRVKTNNKIELTEIEEILQKY